MWHLFFNLQWGTALKDECFEAASTLSYVTSCPATESELNNASSKKHCEVLANIQSCTKPENFRYHCVLNSWNNSTVEVCAPEILSQGKMSIQRL